MDDADVAKLLFLVRETARQALAMPNDQRERFLVEKQGSYLADIKAAGVAGDDADHAALQMDALVRAAIDVGYLSGGLEHI